MWESYRTSRCFGYGNGSVTELTEVPGILARGVHNSRAFRYGHERDTELIKLAGTGMKVIQNFQKCRILRHWRTRFTNVPGRYKYAVSVPRVLWHGSTECAEVSDKGMNVT